jgi:hypothetical protein
VNNVAAELAAVLRERRAIIADEASRRSPERHIERLKTVSQRIDSVAAQLPQSTHPQLKHFLQNASYDKALEFLETNESTIRQPTAR